MSRFISDVNPTRAQWLVSAAACSAFSASVGTRAIAQALPIRIGASPNEAVGAAFYGVDQGMFDRAGLSADVITLQNGAAIVAAVAGGSADIGACSPFVFMNARRHGLPLTLIGPGAVYDGAHPTAALTVATGSPIRTAHDLNGKVIGGITVGALDQLAILAWIDQNGGDSKTVQVIEVPLAAMADAMEQGRIAAALIQEPQLTPARPRVRIIGNAYDAIARRFMISVWFTTNDWATKNPAAVKRFGDAVAQAGDWANANPQKAAVSILKWTKVNEPAITTISAINSRPLRSNRSAMKHSSIT